MSREAAGHEVDCSNVPALIECRFVRRFSEHTLHEMRHGLRTIADILENVRHAVSVIISDSDVFSLHFTNPHAACLIKEAQLLTCIPKKADGLIERLQQLAFALPVHSPALAVFAVELFRSLRLKICMRMSIEANQHYEEMCYMFSTIVADVGGDRHCELFA